MVFLNKNTAIGKSLSKAKTLQKNYEHFESVAQVSFTSSWVLLDSLFSGTISYYLIDCNSRN